jgi:hypothetical protein
MTQNTKQPRNNDTTEQNEFKRVVNLQKKALFIEEMAKMLTISSPLVKVDQIAAAICEQSRLMTIELREIERNESDRCHCSRLCGQCAGSDL